MNQIVDAIEKEQQRADANTFKVGDSVRVHTRVVEGDKERIQIFAGVVKLSQCDASRTARAWSGYFRCTRRASQRWKWNNKAAHAERN
jgi:ribosomal protein L19